MTQIIFRAKARRITGPPLPASYVIRSPAEADAPRLGRLMFDSGVPDAQRPDADAAIREVTSYFHGECGSPWAEASGIVECDGVMAAALLAVRSPPWPGLPAGPFITDLFTSPSFRRRRLARTLVERCVTAAADADQQFVALLADSGNEPAIHLHESLGFRRYESGS